MSSGRVSGTEGYAEEAQALLRQYEAIAPERAHAPVLHLIPAAPAHVIDIGSGTGRDAAWLAGMGHAVVAVEPTAELRLPAMALHPSPRIEWIDDSLPDLAVTRARDRAFDLVLLTAVWMHLDEGQRHRAMPNVAALIRPGGTMIMTVRHGPVPPGRRMFEISDRDTIALAQNEDLSLVLQGVSAATQAANCFAGVSWSQLAFTKPARTNNIRVNTA